MRVRLNPIMMILGSLAAVVGGWGLFTMMTTIGGAPPVIGILSIAILELFAVGLAIHSVKVAQDGDSPFPFNAAITAIAVLAAVVQFTAAVIEGKGVLFGTVMAMAPVAASRSRNSSEGAASSSSSTSCSTRAGRRAARAARSGWTTSTASSCT